MRLSQPNSVFTCRKFNLPFHAGKAFLETTSGQERLLPNPKLLLREHLTSF
jgi:hypothetical protein